MEPLDLQWRGGEGVVTFTSGVKIHQARIQDGENTSTTVRAGSAAVKVIHKTKSFPRCLLFHIQNRKKMGTNLHWGFMVLIFFATSQAVWAQSIVGIWKTIDDTDNVEKSHIEIYEQDGKYFGKVTKLLEGATVHVCSKCKGDLRDKPVTGMVIMQDLEKEGDRWEGGTILDPASGKSYKCQIELEETDKLKLRGYIGIPAFGRTQYWYRVNG